MSQTALLAVLLLAALLFAHGDIVNKPAWDFGRLLGVNVVCSFVVAQLISRLVFNQPPARSTLVGGALIVAGGLIIALR